MHQPKALVELIRNVLFFKMFIVISRVGDCFDPILDPTPDRNPFWIAIRDFRMPIQNFGSRSDLFGSRSAIGSQSPTIGLEIVSIRFSIRPPIAIRFGSQSENLGSRSKILDRDPKSSDRNRQSDRNLQP
jgi:hypothetical protein